MYPVLQVSKPNTIASAASTSSATKLPSVLSHGLQPCAGTNQAVLIDTSHVYAELQVTIENYIPLLKLMNAMPLSKSSSTSFTFFSDRLL